MVRRFPAGAYFECATPALSSAILTLAALVKPTAYDGNWSLPLVLRTASGYFAYLTFTDTGELGAYAGTGGADSLSGINVPLNEWSLIVATKATGSVVPRLHRYDFDSHTWQHAPGSVALNNPTGLYHARIGSDSGGSPLVGDMAIAGYWGAAMSDAEVEALNASSLDVWATLKGGPIALWPCDQANTSDPLLDTIGPSDEVARGGVPAAVSADPPIPYTPPADEPIYVYTSSGWRSLVGPAGPPGASTSVLSYRMRGDTDPPAPGELMYDPGAEVLYVNYLDVNGVDQSAIFALYQGGDGIVVRSTVDPDQALDLYLDYYTPQAEWGRFNLDPGSSGGSVPAGPCNLQFVARGQPGDTGAPGPAGPAGAAGTIDRYFTSSPRTGDPRVPTNCLTGVTTLLPVPTVNHQDGEVPASFTRNADGTVTVNKTGTYVVTAIAGLAPNATGRRILYVFVGGPSGTTIGHDEGPGTAAGIYTELSVAQPVRLNAGDVVGVYGYQNSGATLSGWVDHFGIAAVGSGPKGDQGIPGAGGILAQQHIEGVGDAYTITHSVTSGGLFPDASRTKPLELNYTPPVDCWWEIHLFNAYVRKMEATYHYFDQILQLTAGVIPAIGTPGQQGGYAGRSAPAQLANAYLIQNSAVNAHEYRDVSAVIPLSAGVNYNVMATFSTGGGTWQYYYSPAHLYMDGKAWVR